jgi:MFS family permease
VLVAIGLWVRLRIGETPAFAAALKEAPPESVPIATVLRDHLHAVLAGTLGGITCFAIFYLTTAFLLGYGTTALGYGRSEFLLAQIGGTVFLAVGIALSGVLSDRYSPRVVLMLGCAGTLALAGPLMAPMIEGGSIGLSFVYLSIALLCMGLAYGPLGAWLPGLFPARVRYTGASVAFNIGAILGGAIAPFVAQTMAQAGGLTPVGLYLSGCGFISLLGLLVAPPRDERVPAPVRSARTL